MVDTSLVSNLPLRGRLTVHIANWLLGNLPLLTPEQGSHSQLWCAAGGKRSDMVNGAYYMPVGVMSNGTFDAAARDQALAKKLWDWTDDVLSKY